MDALSGTAVNALCGMSMSLQLQLEVPTKFQYTDRMKNKTFNGFTKNQILGWRLYAWCRWKGYDMESPDTRKLAGMIKRTWDFSKDNYQELEKANELLLQK
jgi:hypothetical protein